jgi:hypothetical protein
VNIGGYASRVNRAKRVVCCWLLNVWTGIRTPNTVARQKIETAKERKERIDQIQYPLLTFFVFSAFFCG